MSRGGSAGGDEDRVLDRDARDPVDRDGPLVIGQRLRRTAAEPAERLVEAGDRDSTFDKAERAPRELQIA